MSICVNVSHPVDFTAPTGERVLRQGWYVNESFEGSFADFKKNFPPHQEINLKEEAKIWCFGRQVENPPVDEKKKLVKRNNREAFSGLSALVLDYDGGASLAEFAERHKHLSWVAYTTFSHRTERKGGKDCFRVILELADDVPWDLMLNPSPEHDSIKPALLKLFQGVDASCFEPSRGHYGPSVSPGGERELLISDGSPFDWTQLELTPRLPSRTERTISYSSEEDVDSSQSIRLADGGFITAIDLWETLPEGYEHRVSCYRLDGPDSSPGCFIYKNNGSLFHFDSSRNKGTWLRIFKQVSTVQLELKKKVLTEDDEATLELTVPEQRKFSAPMSAAQRSKLIKDFVEKAISRRHAVLRTAEGFGKSTGLVNNLLRLNKKILFCCSSNKQANEKVESFALHGAERVWSTRGLFEHTFGVKPAFVESDEPWGSPSLDEAESIEIIKRTISCTNEEAVEAMDAIKEQAQASRHSSAPLCVTTFNLANILCSKGTDRVIIVDDPGVGDFLTTLHEFNGEELEVVATREPSECIFGSDIFGTTVIWTTTEKLTCDFIKKHHPEALVVDIDERIATDKSVLLYPTWMTRKLIKQVLPGIHRCALENTHRNDVKIIANGLSEEYNLVNNKGRNDLTGDSLIIISHPHPLEVVNTSVSLGLSQSEVVPRLVSDLLNQALGRTHGHRACDANTLVLCDPKLEPALKYYCRYELVGVDGLTRRGRLNGVPIELPDKTVDWWVEWVGYLTTWQKWVMKIGDRIVNTLTLQEHRLPKHDLVKLQAVLNAPLKRTNKSVDLIWKHMVEVVPEDGDSRRNLRVDLDVLLNKINENVSSRLCKTRNKTQNKTRNKTRTGKMTYVSPDGNGRKLCVPGTQPDGWEQINEKGRK